MGIYGYVEEYGVVRSGTVCGNVMPNTMKFGVVIGLENAKDRGHAPLLLRGSLMVHGDGIRATSEQEGCFILGLITHS